MLIGAQLAGRFQLHNSLNAVVGGADPAESQLSHHRQNIVNGIATREWRLTVLESCRRVLPDVYLDGAHNRGRGAGVCAIFWKRKLMPAEWYLIFGALRAKAVDEVTRHLFPHPRSGFLRTGDASGSQRPASFSDMAGRPTPRNSPCRGRGQASCIRAFEGGPRRTRLHHRSLYLVRTAACLVGTPQKSRVALETTVEWASFRCCWPRGRRSVLLGAQNSRQSFERMKKHKRRNKFGSRHWWAYWLLRPMGDDGTRCEHVARAGFTA